MDAHTLIFSGKTATITNTYSPPIALKAGYNYSLALTSFDGWNSIPNVGKTNCEFRYRDTSTSEWKTISLETGSYEIDDITKSLNEQLKKQKPDVELDDEPLKITPNASTMKCTVKCIYDIDFETRTNSIASLLGFTAPRILKAGEEHASDKTVDIINISSILIRCNIISASYLNDKSDHILYSFYPTEPVGYKINIVPNNFIYLPVMHDVISSITLDVVDQEGRHVDFRGEQITLTLYLRGEK